MTMTITMKTKKIPKNWRQAKVVALLKPGKDTSVAKSFRPISQLCHTYKLFERLILNRIAEHVDAKLIPEQAGFRSGKSCTNQLLNLTEHIEDGYEKRLITGAVLEDLSAAYATVNHRRLLSKVLEVTDDVHLTDLIRTLLESRRFFVVLNVKKSRWRRNETDYHKEVYWHRCCSTFTPTISPYTPTLAASSTQTTCASRRKETTSTTSKRHSHLPWTLWPPTTTRTNCVRTLQRHMCVLST